MQVVIRSGVLLEATPPDYTELDLVPSELRYTLSKTSSSEATMLARPLSNTLSSPLNKTASGPLSSFSQEHFRQVWSHTFRLDLSLAPDYCQLLFIEVQYRAQAVEREVNKQLAIMRPHPKFPAKRSFAWLLLAFFGSLTALWLFGSFQSRHVSADGLSEL